MNIVDYFKERYEHEISHNKTIEEKSFKFIITSTLLIPIVELVNFKTAFIILDFLLVITVLINLALYLSIIWPRQIKFALDSSNYFLCDELKNEDVENDLKLNENDLKKFRIIDYLKCANHNSKIVRQKGFLLVWLSRGFILHIAIFVIYYASQINFQ